MSHHGVRLLVAILTFTIGIAVAWTLQLIPNLENAVLDRFWNINTSDVSPVILVSDPTEDANEIYRLLIQQELTFNDEIKLIVLEAETTGCAMYEDESVRLKGGHSQTFHEMLKESMPEAEPQTLDNYLAANESPKPLRVANLGINYVLVKHSDVPNDGYGFWTRFYKKYPHSSGILFFSDVGFNDRHDQAFVYAGKTCGGLCGAGEYVLLRKINGRWEILKENALWVS